MFCLGFILGIGTGVTSYFYVLGDRYAIEEIKVCEANLAYHNPSPQLREYLKTRLYWNAAHNMRYRDDFFTGSLKLDYGPVDTHILGEISGIKDAASPRDIYTMALARFEIKETQHVPPEERGVPPRP